MYLAFFIIAALDLLDALQRVSTQDERQDYTNWIYHCQHPGGGFRMWPGTDFGDRANNENAQYDPANVPATYFALASLLALGDDMSRVNRRETLEWLARMQRSNGSFGETLVNGRLEGGVDPRFGYCAAGIRYILRGDSMGRLLLDGHVVDDVDIDKFVRFVNAAEVSLLACICGPGLTAIQAYDGGIADEPFHEPHAGYTFCSLGAVAFFNRITTSPPVSDLPTAPSNTAAVLGWLVSRQTELAAQEDAMGPGPALQAHVSADGKAALQIGDVPTHQSPDKSIISFMSMDPTCAGMNGRINKNADTCYAFWVSASLHLLDQPSLCDQAAVVSYLLQKTQHPILGGFGKFPGDLPDLYHSYLGLAALSLNGGSDVAELDAGMCLSKRAHARLPGLWQGFM